MLILSEKELSNTQVIIVLGKVYGTGDPFVTVLMPRLYQDSNFQTLIYAEYLDRVSFPNGSENSVYTPLSKPGPGVAGVKLRSQESTCVLYHYTSHEKKTLALSGFTPVPGMTPNIRPCMVHQIVSCTIGGLRKTKPSLKVEIDSLEDSYLARAGEYTILRRIEQIGRSLALGLTKRGSQ